MEKDNIQKQLLRIGRRLIQEKGTDALTARKLSEASGCSVGAIYNQFANMDNFIVIQNYMTLESLADKLSKVPQTDNAYTDINMFLQTFINFVINNKNLWFLLYNFHLRKTDRNYSFFYLRKVVSIIDMMNDLIQRNLPNMEKPERILSAQILWLTLFSLSSFLTKDMLDSFAKIDKQNLCRLVMNNYLAGLSVLEKTEQPFY